MKIGNRDFQDKNKTYIMGILNVTPDSFSDGGLWQDRDAALWRVQEMLDQGMDVLDIGGESTRPGYDQISDEEEIARVVPVIEAVKARFDVPISLDTYKSGVAREGIRAGADMINDIWGLKGDCRMGAVIAQGKVACCLMHNRSEQGYQNLMDDVAVELAQSAELARRAGIPDDKILLDPGVGFGKTYEENLEVIRSLDHLAALGYPLLLGASRKSVIGLTLDLPAEQRLEGTLVTTVFAVLKGCMFIRVHDIIENVRAVRMAEAILAGQRRGR
ncbi:MAG: dihydropteroate synthase [Lachnospiraceae bacterium]|nr:dihydropteroate synthase [Lachnospiraceae bacterium]